jgi:hypothetical protein
LSDRQTINSYEGGKQKDGGFSDTEERISGKKQTVSELNFVMGSQMVVHPLV